MLRTCATALAAALAAACPAAAGEARVLTDFTGEGEWTVSQWSKAKGRLAVRPESPPPLGEKGPGKALGVKISFPGGGGFHFLNLLPAKPFAPVSHKVLSISLWVMGAGTKHYLHATFEDADGKEQKVGLGQLEGEAWQKRTFQVPSSWAQPLTLKSISFHDWGINDPADLTTYLARMEVEVDPKVKVQLARGRPTPVGDLGASGSWRPYEWNKAKGTVTVSPEFPPEAKPAAGRSGKSLKVDVRFAAGGTFEFFQLYPAEPLETKDPNTVVAASCWVKGTGTGHGIEFYFSDGEGKQQKAACSPATLGFDGWKLVRARVPRKWAQPVSFAGLGFHNYGLAEAAEIGFHLAECVAEVGEIEKKVYVPLPRVKLPGAERVYSDLNLPGEWRPGAWNSAVGTVRFADDFPEEVKTAPGELRRCMQVELTFAGSFQFFGLDPASAEAIPYKVNGVQVWVKGSETPHTIEFHFADADGKGVKVSPKPGRLDFYGWQQLTAAIPKTWAQPLTWKGITIHNYSFREAAEIRIRATRLIVIIDPKQKLGDAHDARKTNDNW